MSKFIFLSKGPATPMDQYTGEQSAAQMAAWGVWMEKAGPALVDAGAPFTPSRTAVRDDGSATEAADLNGYTIVQADSLQAATALTDGHPFLSDGNGKFTVEIFELGEM